MTLSPDARRLLERLRQARGLPAGDAGIPRRPPGGRVPLAPSQEGMWFLHRLDPARPSHNVPAAARIEGPLDAGALQRSIAALSERHEALRSRVIEVEGDEPCQEVVDSRRPGLRVVDLTGLDADAAEHAARDLVRAEALHAFDLEREPLFRASLARLAPDRHVLCLNLHHLVADGWSIGILTREMQELYEAFAAGRAPALAPPPLQFADYAVWQRQRLDSGVLDESARYWEQQLTPLPPPLPLPDERPVAGAPSYRGRHEPFAVRGTAGAELARLAATHGTTPFVVLLASFAAALAAACGRDEVVVGSTFANRSRPELEAVVGHFANTLPLRLRLDPRGTFGGLLAHARQQWLGAQAHQEVSLARLVSALRVPRRLGDHPLFRVVFDFLTPDHNPAVFDYGLASAATETRRLGQAVLRPLHVDGAIARFTVAAFLWELPGGPAGAIEYATDELDAASVRRLVALFDAALSAGVSDPDRPLGSLLSQLAALASDRRDRDETEYRSAARARLAHRLGGTRTRAR